MSCKICKKEIPRNLPRQTKYCSDLCRASAKRDSKNKWHQQNKDNPEVKEKARLAQHKYRTKNKENRNKSSQTYYYEVLKNSEKHTEYRKELLIRLNSDPEWVESKKKKGRDYYQRTKITRLQKIKKYKEDNPARLRTWTGKRKKVLKLATPRWLTKEQWDEMNHMYWLCRDLRATTGEEYHVDHIVPLQGQYVCGLHVPWNLQVLPADVNLTKGSSVQPCKI